jgi:hypothetical protein
LGQGCTEKPWIVVVAQNRWVVVDIPSDPGVAICLGVYVYNYFSMFDGDMIWSMWYSL